MSLCPRSASRFVAGAALAVAAAYGISEAADPVYPEMRNRAALFRERLPAVQAAAVGNSHGGSIDFAVLGVTGFNFSMAGQDAFEGAHLARYAAEAPRLRYVLFAASYAVQQKDHAVVGSVDLRSRRRQLYAATPLRRPIPGDGLLWLGGMLSPLVRDDHWKGVLARPVYIRPPVQLEEDGRRRAAESPPLTRDSLARYGAGVGAMHRDIGAQTVERAPDTPARLAATLHALARDLRARGITLVLYTPPYHQSYLGAQDPSVVQEAHAILRQITADNPNAVFLDYAADPRFSARDDLFTNSDHLNRSGARAFSRLLRGCLDAVFAGTAATATIPGCAASVRT